MALDPGTKFGRYEIRSKIGEGGMGEVYLADDTTLHRRVAIKFLSDSSIQDQQAKQRLMREAQAAAKLDHPNICAVHEVAEEKGRSFIVMSYVPGETLNVRIKQKPFGVSESLALASEIVDALAEAHTHGIIHRDVKPSNIIITPRGQAKIMDFGLAKWTAPDDAEFKVDAEASTQRLLTTPGTIIGTVPYMSPEQVHGQPLDARTDIFSFGVVLYEMLTGHQLFAAETPAGTISAILTKEPAPLRNYSPTCPDELQRVMSHCLAKDREQRYQTMRDLAADLEAVRRELESGRAISTGQTATLRMETAAAGASRRWRGLLNYKLALVVILVAIAAIASVSAFWFRARSPVKVRSARLMDSPAYDFYVRGKVKVSSEAREDNEAAINLLEQAIAADSNFAPAYAELARAYNIKAFYFASDAQRKKLSEDAEVNVEKALALNPDLAEAHFARGLILWTHTKRFPHAEAIQSYRRALALNPNLDEAHHQLGLVYLHIGLLDKGWDEIQKALSINPNNTIARFRFGVIDLYRARYEDALAVFNSTPLEKNPSLWAFQTATALFQLGRTQEAEAIVDDYLKKYPADEGGVGTSVKAMILAKGGKEREAEEMIKHAIEIGSGFGHFHHAAYNIACAYALMNKPEEANKWLQNAADDGFPCYPLFEHDANLNSLRKDERFIAFMASLKRQWNNYQASL